MKERIKEILHQLIADPKENQIQIDFDIDKKIFILSIPIYQAASEIPQKIIEYVEARKDRVFKPHATAFVISDLRTIQLIQKIPFQWGLKPDVRKELLEFLLLAKRCHRMLYEIALEETVQTALEL